MPKTFVQRTSGQAVNRQLAQSTPTNTAAVSLYSPGDGVQGIVKKVYICNVTGAAAAFAMWHDDDGTDYTVETRLYMDNTITANTTRILSDEIYIDSSGNLAVRSDITAALTFTLYGEETRTR